MLRRTPVRFLIPEEDVHTGHARDVIVKRSDRGLQTMVARVPDGDQHDMEKDNEVGEVISTGPAVPETSLKKGDIVLYRSTHGFPIPNGANHAIMYKIEYPISVITVIARAETAIQATG